MSQGPQRIDGHANPRGQDADLLRSNELLSEELRRLYRENADLIRKLHAATVGSEADREGRRAALNLMEDAVDARRAEERETAVRRQVEEELREANRRKDEFLATLAHELRNPLAPIRNCLHLLRRAAPDVPGMEPIHDMLERQVCHLVRLVDDLMEVSRITRGAIELRRERVNLGDILRSAVETSRPLIEAGRHDLHLDLPGEALVVDADTVRLAQVFTNLLNNAAKYTDPGGRIWLSVRRDRAMATVTVRDTGIGIPGEMMSKVFELFTQVDKATGRAQGGLGIGLTLVRSLVEMHGGTVEGRSEGHGRGSEFTVRLPLVVGKATHIRSDASELPPLPHQRILVVDDNRDAADSLGTLLRHFEAEVCIANDGPSALEALRTHKPSAVLMDIGMPGMDGNEVARRARMLPEGRVATLIALTGWGQEEDVRRSKAAGFDHHLVKPVEIAALRALLASVAGR